MLHPKGVKLIKVAHHKSEGNMVSRAALYASGSADTPGIVAVASRWGVRLEGS